MIDRARGYPGWLTALLLVFCLSAHLSRSSDDFKHEMNQGMISMKVADVEGTVDLDAIAGNEQGTVDMTDYSGTKTTTGSGPNEEKNAFMDDLNRENYSVDGVESGVLKETRTKIAKTSAGSIPLKRKLVGSRGNNDNQSRETEKQGSVSARRRRAEKSHVTRGDSRNTKLLGGLETKSKLNTKNTRNMYGTRDKDSERRKQTVDKTVAAMSSDGKNKEDVHVNLRKKGGAKMYKDVEGTGITAKSGSMKMNGQPAIKIKENGVTERNMRVQGQPAQKIGEKKAQDSGVFIKTRIKRKSNKNKLVGGTNPEINRREDSKPEADEKIEINQYKTKSVRVVKGKGIELGPSDRDKHVNLKEDTSKVTEHTKEKAETEETSDSAKGRTMLEEAGIDDEGEESGSGESETVEPGVVDPLETGTEVVEAENAIEDGDEQSAADETRDLPESLNEIGLAKLYAVLKKPVYDNWVYGDAVGKEELALSADILSKAMPHHGYVTEQRLWNALGRAIHGFPLRVAVVGGSISRGAPFVSEGAGNLVFHQAVQIWWNAEIAPILGSRMEVTDVSIGGSSTDYYVGCLRSHLPVYTPVDIVFWEQAANDMKRYENETNRMKYLDEFIDVVLTYPSNPTLIMLNFFLLFPDFPRYLRDCSNIELEGQLDVATKKDITVLSWRRLVCDSMQKRRPHFSANELFSKDKFHPSVKGHAQMAYLIIEYLRDNILMLLQTRYDINMRGISNHLVFSPAKVPKSIYRVYDCSHSCHTYLKTLPYMTVSTMTGTISGYGNFHPAETTLPLRNDIFGSVTANGAGQLLTLSVKVPPSVCPNMDRSIAIVTNTDHQKASVSWDDAPWQLVNAKERFLKGMVTIQVATKINPGMHELKLLTHETGFIIYAVIVF